MNMHKTQSSLCMISGLHGVLINYTIIVNNS